MKIGELARATETSLETIRFYEREGLLPAPQRTPGNFRIYGPEHAKQLAFIRFCRGFDMALNEIRLLMRFKDSPNEDCGEINALLDNHIAKVARRIHELQQLECELKALRGRCGSSRKAKDCGVLECLFNCAPGRTGPAAEQRCKAIIVTPVELADQTSRGK